jgi:hypothetical protein
LTNADERNEDSKFQLLSRIPADVGDAEIGSVHILLATINTKLLKKSWAKSDDPINFYEHKCVFPMFDRPLCGWLPWALGESKKFFLFRIFLVISWAFIMHTQKNNFEKFFSKKINISKI